MTPNDRKIYHEISSFYGRTESDIEEIHLCVQISELELFPSKIPQHLMIYAESFTKLNVSYK